MGRGVFSAMHVRLLFAMAAIGIAVGACSAPVRGPAVPRIDTERALPLGIANARIYPDSDPQPMVADATEALQREIAALPPGAKLPRANYLAVSGGGDNGAFGAGLLNAWTETGTRPQFKGVTGVSTGALIAPLAFLGPQYDPALREVYTTINADLVYRFRGLTAALFDD